MKLAGLAANFSEIVSMKKAGSDAAQFESSAIELLKAISSLEDVTCENESGRDALHCNVLIELSNSCKDRAAYNEAWQYAQNAIAIAEQKNLQPQLAKANFLAGFTKRLLHEYESALAFYHKSFSISEGLENKNDMAICLREMGVICNSTGESIQALEWSNQSLLLFEALNDRKMIAVVTADIGIACYQLSDLTKAIEYMSRAVDMFTALGERKSAAKHTGNIGNVYWSLGDYSKALEYMKRSIAMNEDAGYRGGDIAYNLANMGRVYASLSDYENALKYTNDAIKIFVAEGDKKAIAFFTTANATNYIQLADYEKAFENITSTLALCEQLGDKEIAASNLLNLGGLYAAKGFKEYDTAKAEVNFKNALAQFEKMSNKGLQSKSHEALAEFYQDEKRWDEALAHYTKYHELEKQVQSEEATKGAQQLENRRKIEEAERDRQVKLAVFEEKEKILHSVLPPQIAERIVAGEKQIADYFPAVSILFADIEGFTPMSADMPAHMVVKFLNHVFSAFDHIMKKHGVEKIKTIGDGYMAIAGAPATCEDHAERITNAALEMMNSISVPADVEPFLPDDAKLAIRVGLHTGSVVAGVVGADRFVYDVYSDAVNTAARMESHGESGKIHVSADFMKHLTNRFAQNKIADHGITFEKRGEIEVKGKGKMKTYFIQTR